MIFPVQKTVLIDSIDLGQRARKVYSGIEELAADIKERGVMHPPVIEEKLDGSGYLLVAGGRRMIAIISLGWIDTPASVYPPLDVYDHEAAELAENINREDLTFVERANSIKRVHALYEEKYGKQHGSGGGHSQSDTAILFGVSRATVQRELEIANALDVVPSLAECKTATEALKKFKRIEESYLRSELTKRADIILARDNQADFKRQLIANYHVGDFFAGAAELPSRSFHVAEVDPDYAIDIATHKKGVDTNLADYHEVAKDGYSDFLDKLIAEVKRLLLSDGWLILWFGMHPWYHTIEDLLKKHNFSFCNPAIWTKPFGQTMWPDRYMASCYEPFFYARKGNAVLYKQGRSNIFNFPPVHADHKVHPTERPVDLMMAVLECFAPPHGRVLVPFGGSGNTLLAASNLGMTSTCWDLSQAYKDAFTSKVLEGSFANGAGRP